MMRIQQQQLYGVEAMGSVPFPGMPGVMPVMPGMAGMMPQASFPQQSQRQESKFISLSLFYLLFYYFILKKNYWIKKK